MHVVQLFQVTSYELVDRMGDRVRIGCVDVRSHERQPLQQVTAINEDRSL